MAARKSTKRRPRKRTSKRAPKPKSNEAPDGQNLATYQMKRERSLQFQVVTAKRALAKQHVEIYTFDLRRQLDDLQKTLDVPRGYVIRHINYDTGEVTAVWDPDSPDVDKPLRDRFTT